MQVSYDWIFFLVLSCVRPGGNGDGRYARGGGGAQGLRSSAHVARPASRGIAAEEARLIAVELRGEEPRARRKRARERGGH